MNLKLELNDEDITKILAKYFNTSVDNVHLHLQEVYEGYGIGERRNYLIKCTIVKDHLDS